MWPSQQYSYVPPVGRMMVFVDGENLVHRYEAMLGDDRLERETTKRKKGIYVWNDIMNIDQYGHLITRTSYYTSCTGDEDFIIGIKNDISAFYLEAHQHSPLEPPGGVRVHNGVKPVVIRKTQKNRSSKGVDIQITIDILSNCYQKNFDAIYLLSGDADFIPVIEEVMRHGKKVFVGAFSSGLSPNLKVVGDGFWELDKYFF
jgi:uncharacterized LabA/DUF88 family protein